tara:strand:- start:29513 stop:30427 length:915 start_codon:yes stop_codon:yes gene_type:complete
MFGQFYNGAMRNMVIAFGSLFNNIVIKRTGSSESIRVPLAYGPKEKYLRRANDPSSISDDTKVQITLPYMSFEITNMGYDSARKRNTIHKRLKVAANDSSRYERQFTEVPYDLEFSLYVMVRHMEDGLQIVEQILPFFTPEFNVTMNFTEINNKVDIPIVLNAVSLDEEYEGDFDARRNIIFTLTFSCKSYVYGPIKTQEIIRTVQTRFFEMQDLVISGFSGGANHNIGLTGQVGITGATGALSRVDIGVSGATVSGATYDTETNLYVRGGTGLHGLCAGGGCGPGYVGPWFIDVFGNTGGYGS